jgi:hypothetical protein
MTKRTSLPYAALVVALFALAALAATAGGAAVAAKTIGKNLVVTKSIKNGAVTGAKVKDGSLTAADLAPGTIPTIPTIPAPTNGKAAAFASTLTFSPSTGGEIRFTPFGPGSVSTAFGALAPTALSVADLHVLTDVQAAGATVQISLVTAPTFVAAPTTVLTCTVATAASSCTSPQQGTIPAGNVFWMVATNGPTGPSSAFAAVSYTIKVL